jgi:arylamine N-acetyltransferase
MTKKKGDTRSFRARIICRAVSLAHLLLVLCIAEADFSTDPPFGEVSLSADPPSALNSLPKGGLITILHIKYTSDFEQSKKSQ